MDERRSRGDEWDRHSVYVLEELKRLSVQVIDCREDVVALKLELAVLKTKIALYATGLAAGVSLLSQFLFWLFTHGK